MDEIDRMHAACLKVNYPTVDYELSCLWFREGSLHRAAGAGLGGEGAFDHPSMCEKPHVLRSCRVLGAG